MPLRERSRAVAFVFNGFNIGSVLGLSAAPLIIEAFGWRTVFEVFGAPRRAWGDVGGSGIYAREARLPDAGGGFGRLSPRGGSHGPEKVGTRRGGTGRGAVGSDLRCDAAEGAGVRALLQQLGLLRGCSRGCPATSRKNRA